MIAELDADKVRTLRVVITDERGRRSRAVGHVIHDHDKTGAPQERRAVVLSLPLGEKLLLTAVGCCLVTCRGEIMLAVERGLVPAGALGAIESQDADTVALECGDGGAVLPCGSRAVLLPPRRSKS